MQVHIKTQPLEIAHLVMPLRGVICLVSVCIGCSKLLHTRDKLNGQIIFFETGSTGGEHTLRVHLSVITQNSSIAVAQDLTVYHWCKDFLRLLLQVTRKAGTAHGYDVTITFDHIKLFLGQLLGKDCLPPIQQYQKLAFQGLLAWPASDHSLPINRPPQAQT